MRGTRAPDVRISRAWFEIGVPHLEICRRYPHVGFGSARAYKLERRVGRVFLLYFFSFIKRLPFLN